MSNWIPASKKVPDEIVPVLVVTSEPMYDGREAQSVLVGFYDGECWQLEARNFNLDERVTHWMPFPDLPVLTPDNEEAK